MEEKQKGFWNILKARWYIRGLKYSALPEKALKIILPRTRDCKTFLDVGSGCGALAIPLANAGKIVTVLDPSRAMISVLQEEVKKKNIKNIRTVNAAWGDIKIKPHDVILCANVPELLHSETFIKEADKLARKALFLIEGAAPNADKFYYKGLYPIIFNKEFPSRNDYLKTYTILHNSGIFANIDIIDYSFDQPFDNLNEAVEFWKEYMGIVTEEHDEKLKTFLIQKLEKVRHGLIARFKKKSAIVWWKKK